MIGFFRRECETKKEKRRELRTHLNRGRVRFLSVPYLCVQVVRWSGVGHQAQAALVPQRLQGWSAHSVCGLCYLLVPGHPDTQRHLRGTAWPGHGPVHGEAFTGFTRGEVLEGQNPTVMDACVCVCARDACGHEKVQLIAKCTLTCGGHFM